MEAYRGFAVVADVVRPRRGDLHRPPAHPCVRVLQAADQSTHRRCRNAVHALLDSPQPTIIAGDFKAHGVELHHTHMPDVIDIAVTRGLAASIDFLDEHLISDQQAVLLTMRNAPTILLPSPKHRQDWRVFAIHGRKLAVLQSVEPCRRHSPQNTGRQFPPRFESPDATRQPLADQPLSRPTSER
ncbi:jg2608 [Pararge aegeria aegeria]|uniref:Jg2608 protein n=1 Tax=Pararge aegeria aegeria TaxID=348720 RepID=A0A8S4R2J3_9NEOP|nr:jg2608 [Pararge aegeria aegeria]